MLLSKTGTFYKTKLHIAEQGNKAMFSLLRKVKQLSLPLDLIVEMFYKMIKPVLLYGSEVWGFGNCENGEKVQLRY